MGSLSAEQSRELMASALKIAKKAWQEATKFELHTFANGFDRIVLSNLAGKIFERLDPTSVLEEKSTE